MNEERPGNGVPQSIDQTGTHHRVLCWRKYTAGPPRLATERYATALGRRMASDRDLQFSQKSQNGGCFPARTSAHIKTAQEG